MQAMIQNISVDIPLQSVSLTPNKKNVDNIYGFRCYRCGTTVAQIKGSVIGIVAGIIPTDDVVVIHRCGKCKENYTFQTHENPFLNPDITFLSLSLGEYYSQFHCIICRSHLLNYNKDKVELIGSYDSVTLPFLFNCSNSTCLHEYKLTEVVHS